jgi:soluble lytic murein transglycosylase
MKKIILLSFLYILCSCSRLVAPPGKDIYSLEAKQDLTKSERMALKLKGINEDNIPCDKLVEFSEDKTNPLQKWVRIKAIGKCKIPGNNLDELYENKEVLPEWVEEDLLKVVINKSQNPEHKLEALRLLTKYFKTQKEKERHLKDAIKFAEQNDLSTEDLFKELTIVSPRYSKEVTSENIFKVARDFERNRKFKKARRLYKKIIKDRESTLENIVKAWDRTRFSYKLERNKESYRKSTRALVLYLRKFSGNSFASEMNAKYSNILARIYWTQGKFARAKRVIRDVIILEGIPLKHKIDSYYHLGGIYEDQRQYKKSVHYYTKAYNTILESNEEHKHSEAILWNIGWHFYKRKMYSKSIEWLEKYTPKKDEAPEYRFLFWQAQAHKKLKNTDQYEAIINRLRNEDQFGYYGQIAHMNGPALKPINNYVKPHDFKADPLSWAIYLDNNDLIHKIIDATKDIDLLEFYHGKYFDKLIFKYFSLPIDERREYLEQSPLYAYPLAYKDDFIKSNISKNVPTSLLMAIARQESAFNRYARSPADAFGLLQLIPVRARELSRRYKIPYKDFHDLYEPKTNIALSSKLLEKLMRRQKKNFIHFVASYNAGETPVKRWKRTYRHLSDLEFIEEIPYSETRKYVKLVARNILVYKRLLSDKEFKITNNFFRGEY